ncbi:hypothetical protein D3C81_1336260 [compost metagenome]
MAAQRADGLLDIVACRAVTPAGAGQDMAQQVIGQVTGITGQMPLQHEAQCLDLGPVIEATTEPMWPVGGIRHFTLPERQQRRLQRFVRQAIGEATAGTAPIESKHQARALRRTTMLMRPEVQAAMIAMHPCATTLDSRTCRAPYQRAIGKQPDRPAFMQAHGSFDRTLQLLMRQLRPEIQCWRVDPIQTCIFACRHKSRQSSPRITEVTHVDRIKTSRTYRTADTPAIQAFMTIGAGPNSCP